MVQLLHNHGSTQPQLPSYEGGLPPYHLNQILDYIDAHLTQAMKLANLAQLLSMSLFHFSRLFKQPVGISPHQYVIQQRVERAKRLLKQTDQAFYKLVCDRIPEVGENNRPYLAYLPGVQAQRQAKRLGQALGQDNRTLATNHRMDRGNLAIQFRPKF